MIEGLHAQPGGLLRVVTTPSFGRQHLGHAPGGPQDRAAASAARRALGLAEEAAVLEIVAAGALTLTADAALVLAGAPRPGARLIAPGADPLPLPHATVVRAPAGTSLRLGGTAPGPAGGWRTVLAVAPGSDVPPRPLPPLSSRRPPGRPGVLRLLPGPETDRLDDRALLLRRPWRVGPDLSDAGLRLSPVGREPMPRCEPREIASAPLADGCVQLTPSGLVVFLRERPTLGGYPRVGCLPDADVDRAAQLGPGACVRFLQA